MLNELIKSNSRIYELKMTEKSPITIFLIISSTVGIVYLVNGFISDMEFIKHPPHEYSWIVHGMLNILGYMTLFLPGYFTYKYVHKVNYMNIGGEGLCVHIIRACFGEEDASASANNPGPNHQRTARREVLILLFHFFGLQISYLTWGVLQEKVMTQKYQSEKGDSVNFTDSQFLVFINRILAFSLSGLYIMYQKQIRHRCPLYKYTFCSFSNIMSSWCQYESLKYVSFPHQVLVKAAKTIPVMLMGRLISKTRYEYYEYVTSVILSAGMLLFMLDAGKGRADSAITTFSGLILLLLYIIFDSFTSNWQDVIFKTYSVKPVQMMCIVNFYSCIFTSISLLQQGTLFTSVNFMLTYPQFVIDCVVLSICSAVGQLFIFSTIARFGPLVFAIITTIRQGFSVLLSCIIYSHPLNVAGVFGVTLVFVSIFLRIYCRHRLKNVKKNLGKKTQTVSV